MKSRWSYAIVAFCAWLGLSILFFVYIYADREYEIEQFYLGIIMTFVYLLLGMIVPFIFFLYNKKQLLNNHFGKIVCVSNGVGLYLLSLFVTVLLESKQHFGVGWLDAVFIALIDYFIFVQENKPKVLENANNDKTVINEDNKGISKEESDSIKVDILDENEKQINEGVVDIVQEENKHCVKCGKEISSEWDYCYYCGNKLK